MPATNEKARPTPIGPGQPEATVPSEVQGSTGVGRLYAALARAIGKCSAVSKDATNQHHRYAYASAEAIITEARAALSAEGLSLLTVGSTLGGTDGNHLLDVTYLLAHASGESAVINRSWPVVVGNGRPLDKATAGAVTTCLSYTLRDVLLLPRTDEDADPDQRDDREHRPPPKRAPKGDIKAMTPSEPKGVVKVTTPSDGPPPGVEADDLRDQVRALLPKLPEVERKLYESAVKAAGDDVVRLREGLGKLKARVDTLSKAAQ